jgi:hypothetical protein
MIAKCGEKIIHHWAHKGKWECDHWWEPETEWHRNWKGQFPKDWQEVVHQDPVTGERHIADVKTDFGWVIEFQHSFLKPGERTARNNFYKRVVWVVDGKRLVRDEKNFASTYDAGISVGNAKKISITDCSLLMAWSGTNVPVFFDFGQHVLWMLMPIISDESTGYLFPITKSDFLEIFKEGQSQKAQIFWNFLSSFINFAKNPPKQVIYSTGIQFMSHRRLINHYQRRRRPRRF